MIRPTFALAALLLTACSLAPASEQATDVADAVEVDVAAAADVSTGLGDGDGDGVGDDAEDVPADVGTVDADGASEEVDGDDPDGSDAGDANAADGSLVDTDEPIPEDECLNGIDDDADGATDCDDPDCDEIVACRLPEIWVLVRVELVPTSTQEGLIAASTRRPDRWVSLNGDGDWSVYGGMTFDSAGTFYVTNSRPLETRLLQVRDGSSRVLRSGLGAAAQALAVSDDGKQLWVSRFDSIVDPNGAYVIEELDTEHAEEIGRVVSDPDGRHLASATTRPGDSRIWATRSVRLPDPHAGDPGEFEVVQIDPQSLAVTSAPPVAPQRLFVRAATGELYVRLVDGAVLRLSDDETSWEVDAAAPTASSAVPVGEDSWVYVTPSGVQTYSVSEGQISFLPFAEPTTVTARPVATLAPPGSTLEDYIFE